MIRSILNPLKASSVQLLDMIYPPRCFACSEETDQPHGLCAACWGEADFITGCVCKTCGVPVSGDTEPFICDTCITFPPPWRLGRAVMLYEGSGRRIVLSFKNSDRTDMARPLGQWMARAGDELLADCELIVPVPLHWKRLFQRGYNQSAVLAAQIAKHSKIPFCPDILRRVQATPSQDGLKRQARFDNLQDAIAITKRHAHLAPNKVITLIDDVMTTGATLSSCASALIEAGAKEVRVLVLTRVARDRI